MRFDVPRNTEPGTHTISAAVTFSTQETQTDTFVIHVLPSSTAPAVTGKMALFDPKGETSALLSDLKVTCQTVDAGADLAA